MLFDPNIAARIEASKSASSSLEFADIVEAVGDHYKSREVLWLIGDLLVKHCGRPGKNGAHNGATAKIKRIVAEIGAVHGKKAATDFCFSYLERLRLVASRFSPPSRVGGVDFSVHYYAGWPKNLTAAIAAAKARNIKLTVGFVKDFKRNRHRRNHKPDRITGPKDILRQRLAEDANRAEGFDAILKKGELTVTQQRAVAADLPGMIAHAERILAALRQSSTRVT